MAADNARQSVERSFMLANAVGLHARPAAMLVRTAAHYRAAVRVTHGMRTADARSLLSLLSLVAGSGAEISIHAEGEDAAEALDAIGDLIASNFGE